MHQIKSGKWAFQQELRADDAAEWDQFGASVALGDGVAVVSAPYKNQSVVEAGAVYVFELQGDQWKQSAKLTAPDAAAGDRLGYVVAIDGDMIAASAIFTDTHAQNTGAVYVYHKTAGQWQFLQKIVPSDASIHENFGTGLAMHNGWLIAGAPNRSVPPVGSCGAAIAYKFNGVQWAQAQILSASDASPNDKFGNAISMHADAAVIAALGDDEPNGSNVGSGYVFRLNAGVWQHEAKLALAAPQFSNYDIGESVAIWGDAVLIGSPERDSVFAFLRTNDTWSLRGRIMVDAWDLVNYEDFGHSVSLWQNAFIAGAPLETHIVFQQQHVGAISFGQVVIDCDSDGIADPCDSLDCNGNQRPDECDLAAGETDCDVNSIPDLCQTPAQYQLDTGVAINAYGTINPRDIIWLNQFTVQPGREVIDFVDINWMPFAPVGTATILIYRDLAGTGNPVQSTLVATAATGIYRPMQENVYQQWTRTKVPPTFVGKPGDFFFVGALASSYSGEFPATIDNKPANGHSFFFYGPYGNGDVQNLGNNFLATLPTPHTFMIRVGSSDCNANGIWDGCDISSGTSADANGNGIPDECESDVCVGDLNGDGAVSVPDLLNLVNAWGFCQLPCPPRCAGDITGDCNVTVADLISLLNAWGPCD